MSLEDSASLRVVDDRSFDEAPPVFFGSAADDAYLRLPGAGALGGFPGRQAEDLTTRAFDILFSTIVLIAVAPALLILILALQISSPGPVFFVQQRVGKNGILFPCFKLRTMVSDAPQRLEKLLRESPEARTQWDRDHKLKDDPRVTRLGRFARLFSLDELPQLANILVGQMSVVGPRPIVEAEIWRYGPAFADYCSVRPGLTGLWQVSGRNDTTYEERVRLDREYARNQCLALDLSIIARTFSVVLGARGAY